MKFGTKSESFEQVDISFPVTHTKSHQIPPSTAFLGYNSIEFSWMWKCSIPFAIHFQTCEIAHGKAHIFLYILWVANEKLIRPFFHVIS